MAAATCRRRRIVVIGANYHFEGTVPGELDPESRVPHELGSAYIARSPDGPDDLEVVMNKSFGEDDLVALTHTVSLYEALPEGQLAVVPAASHGLPLEQPETLTRLILAFLAASGPPRTLMPIRRARASHA